MIDYDRMTLEEKREWISQEFAELDIVNLADIQPPDESSFWLIPGLVASTATLVYGETKVGKSYLVANMLASLIDGRKCLGKAPLRDGVHALMAVSDYGAREEYKDRFTDLGIDSRGVDIAQISAAPGADYWHRLRALVKARGYDVLVVDHATGVVRGDINKREPWLEFWQEHLGGFIQDGVAVVVVGHSSDKTYMGVKATTPMGNSAATQFARARVHISKPGNDRGSNKRTIHTVSNNAPEEEIPALLLANGAIVYDQETKTKVEQKQERDSATKEKNRRIAELAVQAPDHSSNNKVGAWIHQQEPELGTSARALGTAVGRLLARDKGLLTATGSGEGRKLALRYA